MACVTQKLQRNKSKRKRSSIVVCGYNPKKEGGILEHPSSSKIWEVLPDVGDAPDDWGGFTIEIDLNTILDTLPTKMTIYLWDGCVEHSRITRTRP